MNLETDQLILEFYTPGEPNSGWIHCSWIPEGRREQYLHAYNTIDGNLTYYRQTEDNVSSNLPKKLDIVGHSLLHDFLQNRAQNYKEEMSSPLTAEYSCSRISPFLSWGLISIRTVFVFFNISLPPAKTSNSAHSTSIFNISILFILFFLQKLSRVSVST